LAILSEETTSSHVQDILEGVLDEIRSGMPLSKAISTQPKSFDTLYQGIVAGAEQSGKLGLVLQELSLFLDKRQALRQQITNALVYPALLISISIMVVIFLMTSVVPQIARVFASSKQQLPFLTRFIIGLSEFLTTWGWLLLLILLLTSFCAHFLIKNEKAGCFPTTSSPLCPRPSRVMLPAASCPSSRAAAGQPGRLAMPDRVPQPLVRRLTLAASDFVIRSEPWVQESLVASTAAASCGQCAR
jgi:hypothetical protein